MRRTGEHRGVLYSIPTSDDGMWRWFIHPPQGYGVNMLNDTPRPTHATFDEAVQAAKKAIDRALYEGVLRERRYRRRASRAATESMPPRGPITSR